MAQKKNTIKPMVEETVEVEVIENAVEPKKKKPMYAMVSAARLNVRKTPSLEAEIIGVLESSQEVEILSEKNDFSEIIYGEDKGYVMSSFLIK